MFTVLVAGVADSYIANTTTIAVIVAAQVVVPSMYCIDTCYILVGRHGHLVVFGSNILRLDTSTSQASASAGFVHAFPEAARLFQPFYRRSFLAPASGLDLT